MKKSIAVTRSSMPPFEEYTEMIRPLWDNHWLTNMGALHNELQKQLMKYLGVPNISLFVNGHMALELTIQAFGFTEGSEVITTPFTFVSTTHAIVRNRLVPVFCDIKEDGTIDESKIEELITDKTVAILPVHVYGNVCNVMAIDTIAKKYNLKVIYDAAHAFGVKYQGQGIGIFGDASIFSFHATKVYNTIEGGAVVFQNSNLSDKLCDLKNFGIRDEELVTDVGANAKMNEFAAAMGLCNLRHVDEALESRHMVYNMYRNRLDGIQGIHILEGDNRASKNWAYMPVIVDDAFPIDRNNLKLLLGRHGIGTRKYFYPLTCDQKCYDSIYQYSNLKKAREMSEKILCLPIYEDLDLNWIDLICKILKECEEKKGAERINC